MANNACGFVDTDRSQCRCEDNRRLSIESIFYWIYEEEAESDKEDLLCTACQGELVYT